MVRVLPPRRALTCGMFPRSRVRPNAPVWLTRLNDPLPLALIGTGSADVFIRIASVIRIPDAWFEIVAAFATGSTTPVTELDPQPLSATAAAARAAAIGIRRGARGTGIEDKATSRPAVLAEIAKPAASDRA